MTQLAVAAGCQKNVMILTTVHEYEGISLNFFQDDSGPVVKKKTERNIPELVNPNKLVSPITKFVIGYHNGQHTFPG